ncbi:MAG: DUF4349 domain-containing protein [Bacteroidota bacterium]
MNNHTTYLLLAFLIFATSCATGTAHHGELTGVRYMEDTYEAVNFDDETANLGYNALSLLSEHKLEQSPRETTTRKIIQNATLSLTVTQPDSMSAQLTTLAESLGGYLSQSGTYQTTIRIPAERFEEAIAAISTMGKLQSKTISGQDVTNQYYDLQIRIENAEKARQRYLELLAKAENVETTLKVEKELERLNTELDLLKGQMKRLENLTTFATINIRHEEKKKPGPLGYIGLGLYHSVKWLFVRN